MNHIVPRDLAAAMAEHATAAKDWSPWPYQELALKIMLCEAQCGLFLDPGMGKTSATLATIKVRVARRHVRRALIVAPLRAIYEVWPFEVSDWKDFHSLGIALLHGSPKWREAALRALKPEHQVVLINFEGLAWLFEKKERLRLLDANMLIIDESSKVKNTNSVRFRALRPHLMKFLYRHILTGSPRPRNYEDLFGQIYILDRGAALGSYITHYRNQYFFPTGFEMREWALLPGKDKEINAKIAPMVLRLDAKDHLKLPATPERIHKITLPDAVRKEYDRIEESLMSELFDAPLQNSTSARSKLCQIANGSVYVDAAPLDGQRARAVKVVHTAKIEALTDLYEELQGEPLLVGIGYHHDVAAIRRAIGKDVPCLNSDTTKGQFASFIKDWNKGRLPLLLGHPASMGHALNMQKCDGRHVAFFDIPDNYDDYDQMFRRVWRQGNKAPFCMKHHLVVTATVDVAKMANLRRKGRGQRDFLDAMRAYAETKYGSRNPLYNRNRR